MIRPLRRRHLAMTATLAVITLAVFIAALAKRETIPAMAALPPALDGRPEAAGAPILLNRDDLWGETAIRTRIWRGPAGLVLELTPRQPLKKPDALVYWRPGPNLTDAYLLGALNGAEIRRFALPEAAAKRDGTLVVYSLAHGATAAEAALSADALKGDSP